MAIDKPTEKQIKALRAFKVDEQEISSMGFNDARAKLKELIERAKQHDASSGGKAGFTHPNESSPASPPKDTFNQLRQNLENSEEFSSAGIAYCERNLGDSIALVREAFKLKPEESLIPYADIVAEAMHEMFSLYVTERIQRHKEKNLKAIR